MENEGTTFFKLLAIKLSEKVKMNTVESGYNHTKCTLSTCDCNRSVTGIGSNFM